MISTISLGLIFLSVCVPLPSRGLSCKRQTSPGWQRHVSCLEYRTQTEESELHQPLPSTIYGKNPIPVNIHACIEGIRNMYIEKILEKIIVLTVLTNTNTMTNTMTKRKLWGKYVWYFLWDTISYLAKPQSLETGISPFGPG